MFHFKIGNVEQILMICKISVGKNIALSGNKVYAVHLRNGYGNSGNDALIFVEWLV